MEYIKLDVPELTSESINLMGGYNNSEYSVGTERSENGQVQEGGFLSSLFGNSKNDKAVLDAGKNKLWDVVRFMVKKQLMRNINAQDCDGNTVLHYAAMDEQNELADFLVSKGADPKIKNNDNQYVGTETEFELMEGDVRPSVQPMNRSSKQLSDRNDSYEVTGGSESQTERFIRNLINKYSQQGQNGGAVTTDTERLADELVQQYSVNDQAGGNITDTQTFLDGLVQKYGINEQDGGNTDIDTNRQVESVLEAYFSKDAGLSSSNRIATNEQNGGASNIITFRELGLELPPLSTEMSLSAGPMHGGSRHHSSKYITGTRYLDNYEDFDLYGGGPSSELSRLVNDQVGEMITSIIADLVKKLKIDEETAKKYKSILYFKVQEEKPELKTPLDRFTEVQKQLKEMTKKELDKIDWETWDKKVVEIIAKRRSENKDRPPRERKDRPRRERREKSSSDESPPSEDNMTISETSSASVPSVSKLSSTSFSSSSRRYSSTSNY